ncbi:hypothetical protein AD933_02055 [Acetobacter malorum]|uniref:F5/8 type C domain-containing protein n=1 Tax=Acetobacter malorum TaxID=178901 RepID=A0A149RXP9_9PROT|nr:discoidin domain-containing protein [Acetobacter malorum]KXV19254.1 hypothetical protein AD933_02055 [Acetobacter malorum]
MAKIYDCFLFFNELDILEMRLNELYDSVDHFVIGEASQTYTGKEKKKYFLENKERFTKFLDKIIYVDIKSDGNFEEVWDREFYQRGQILNPLKNIADDSVIIFSDVDEIPNKYALRKAVEFDGVMHMKMNFFQYYLNMLIDDNWVAPYTIKKKYLNKLTTAEDTPGKSIYLARYSIDQYAHLLDIPFEKAQKCCGWHFTFMGGIKTIQQKLAAYSHTDDYWPAMMKDEAKLQEVLDIGIRIWSNDQLVQYVPVDHTFPKYVQDNQKKLEKDGLIKDVYAAYSALQSMYMEMRKKFCFSNLHIEKPFEELGNLRPLNYIEHMGIKDIPEKFLNLPEPKGHLVSHDCVATQSSRSPWSYGESNEDAATQALIGTPNGMFSFHTDTEQSPWWEVDLKNIMPITEIRIFNRLLPYAPDKGVARRLDNVQIFTSPDRINYKCIYYHHSTDHIGGIDGKPLIVNPAKLEEARYVKILTSDFTSLHLDKVYVYSC